MRISLPSLLLILLPGGTACSSPAVAQSLEYAVLFGYVPADGMNAEFEEGYRRHLDWHRDHDDPLTWLGWSIVAGTRMGMFVDGTFVDDLAEIDRRIEPSGDRADFTVNVDPFARPAFREVYRLRDDLGASFRSSGKQTSRMLSVAVVTVGTGTEREFESVLREIRESRPRDEVGGAPVWYELVAGGLKSRYIRILEIDSWAQLEADRPLHDRIDVRIDIDRREDLLDRLSGSVRSIDSELWLFRPDLTYRPE